MKTCVLIPAYNEAKTIAALINKIKEQKLDSIIIDDGSKDDTSAVALRNGAVVLKNSKNEGKGASLIKGFNYALDKGFDMVIAMDADGQHLPEEIPYFLKAAEDSKSGIIIGNRMCERRNMPLIRVLTNKTMSWLISIVAGINIPDTQCGFRLIKREVLEKIRFTSNKFEIESELIIKAARLGFRIESVPIKSVYQGERSKINPFVDTLRFFRFLFKQLWTTRI